MSLLCPHSSKSRWKAHFHSDDTVGSLLNTDKICCLSACSFYEDPAFKADEAGLHMWYLALPVAGKYMQICTVVWNQNLPYSLKLSITIFFLYDLQVFYVLFFLCHNWMNLLHYPNPWVPATLPDELDGVPGSCLWPSPELAGGAMGVTNQWRKDLFLLFSRYYLALQIKQTNLF